MVHATHAPLRSAFRSLLLLLAILTLAACGSSSPGGGNGGGDGGDGGDPPAAPFDPGRVGGNNNAVLDGPEYGSGSARPATLRRAVPVEVEGEASGFVFGEASLFRSTSGSEYLDLVVPVRNDGEARCFVRADAIAFVSGGGSTLFTEDFDYVEGSVKRLAGGTVTSTCLDEGASGYLLGIVGPEPILFQNTERVRVGSVRANGSDPSEVDAAVVPQSYQISGDDALPSLALTARNEGDATAVLSTLSRYVRLLDGATYGWDFLLDASASEVPPGSSVVFSQTVLFRGTASAMHPFIDFVVGTTAPGFVLSPAARALAVDPRLRTRLRALREAAREEAYAAALERDR